MASKIYIFEVTFILLGLVLVCTNAEDKTFSVISYGAKADGETDDSKAFLDAWTDACKLDGAATLLIPLGTYMVQGVEFIGPCKGSLIIQIKGVIKASTDPKLSCNNAAWISFKSVKALEIEGGGTLDGQGVSAWNKCDTRPSTLKLRFVENAIVHDIHSVDSKMFHFDVFSCNNVTFSHVNVTAPGDSPNTDGIHISSSSNIQVFDSSISTGDDCISIFAGNQNINISGVTCGPGHGISIGSLGKSSNDVVKNIYIKNCTLIATSNGARIKTLASSNAGNATNINFEDIIMNDVRNPIIIDQHYCAEHSCSSDQESSVQIKDVTFNNIRGTSSSIVAVTFNCSSSFPCQGINLNDINLTLNDTTKGPATASCANAIGNATGIELPPSCLKSSIFDSRT